MYRESKKVEEMQKVDSSVRLAMSSIEKQSELQPYENPMDVRITQDYMEMVVQYGYIVLFSAALPIVPAFALLEIMMEIRVDAWKLCNLTRRPFPDKAEDIGVWYYILQTVSYAGALSNAGIIVFTSSIFTSWGTQQQWLLFVGIEHSLLLAKFLISVAVPDVPTKVAKGLKWSSRMATELKLSAKAVPPVVLESAEKLEPLPDIPLSDS